MKIMRRIFRVDAGGTYVKQVGEKATIDVRFRVGNMAERAYETILYVTYDSNELDVPELRKNGSKGSINLGDYSQDLVTVSLGNPLEEKADAVSCVFAETRAQSGFGCS